MAVHHLRHRALVQSKYEHVGTFADQRSLYGDDAAFEPGALEKDVVLGNRIADPPYRIEQCQQGAVRRHEIGERAAAQRRRTGPEKLLGSGIDETDLAVTIDHDHRKGESRQDQRGHGFGYTVLTPYRARTPEGPKRCLDHADPRASSGS